MNARPDGERRDEDEEVGAKGDELNDEADEGDRVADGRSASTDCLQTGARDLNLHNRRIGLSWRQSKFARM